MDLCVCVCACACAYARAAAGATAGEFSWDAGRVEGWWGPGGLKCLLNKPLTGSSL